MVGIKMKVNKILRISGVSALLAILMLGVLPPQPTLAAGWYDLDWNYRKSFTFGNPIVNYQTKILVGESSGAVGEEVDLGGHCQADFDDMRFTAADGTTELDYWIESISGVTPNQLATVWVENDAAPSATGYLYYGNDFISAGSCGNDTFPFFDSFDSLNWQKDCLNPPESSTIQDGILYQPACASGIYMLDTEDGTELQHWMNGTNFASSPIIIGDYIYAWNYNGVNSKLYKINQNTGASTFVAGSRADFECLTTARTGGIDVVFIPIAERVTAIKCSDLTTLWTSLVEVEEALGRWDGGIIAKGYLYTRQQAAADDKLVKVEISTGVIVDEVAIGSGGGYATLLYDEDQDQIIVTERTTSIVRAFDADDFSTENWSYTMEENPAVYDITYSGAYYDGTYYIANVHTALGTNSYLYAIDAITGLKDWKSNEGNAASVAFTNFLIDEDYLYCPTHDYFDGDYHNMMVIDVTTGVKFDDIAQTGDSACYSPTITGGRIFFGMFDDDQVNARSLGNGVNMDCPFKVDAYHTGFVGDRLTEYDPDKTVPDLSKWATAGTTTLVDGTLVLESVAGENSNATGDTAVGDNHALRARVKPLHFDTDTLKEVVIWYNTVTGHGYYTCYDYNAAIDAGKYFNFDGAKGAAAIVGVVADTWHIQDVIRNAAVDVDYYVNDANLVTINTNLTATDKAIYLQAHVITAKLTVDWVLLRLYDDTPQTIGGWGAQEAQAFPVVVSYLVEGEGRDWVILRGYIEDDKGSTVDTIGIAYGATSGYGYTEEITGVALNAGDYFTVTIRDLKVGADYHWAAYGSYPLSDIGYGDDKTFSTEGSPMMYEHWLAAETGDSDDIYGSHWSAMQFTADDMSHTAEHIWLQLKRVGNPSEVTVSLRHANDAGEPDGMDLWRATMDGDTFELAYNWWEFEDVYSLEGGEEYCIVVRAISGDNANDVQWASVVAGGYADGVGLNSVDSGSTWTTDAPEDYKFAIWGNPVFEVNKGAVFEGYIADNDMLFVLDVENVYVPYYPEDNSEAYFDVQLFDIDGTSLLASTPLVDWRRRAVSIYLSPDMAASLTKGNPYYLRMVGSFNPANVIASYQLKTEDWWGDDLEYLDDWVIRMAHTMETDWDETFVDSVIFKGEVLNEDGGTEFEKGIAGLMYVRPDLFKTTRHQPTYTLPSWTDAFEESRDWEDAVGANVYATMNSWGAIIGVQGNEFFVMGVGIVAVAMALLSGYFIFGLVLAIPYVMWATNVGVFPIVPLLLISSLFIFIMAWKWWFSRT